MNKPQPIANTASLIIACKELGIPHSFYDDNRNLIKISLHEDYFFANSSTPFNDEAIGKIFKDKEFTYRIVRNLIRTPRTRGYVDPDCNPDYRRFATFTSQQKILKEIEKEFSYPFMIKMNSGSRGVNVFKCNTRRSAKKSLRTVYDKMSKHYDYVALAQEYVSISREFRVIVFQNKIIFMYEKDFSEAVISDGNISPLHQENSKAILVSDENLLKQVADFIGPLFKKMRIGFAGLDIAIDSKNKLWFIELNSKPGFEYFVRDNGNLELIKMYKEMLLFLKKENPAEAKPQRVVDVKL